MALEQIELNPGSGGAKVNVDRIGGFDYTLVKPCTGGFDVVGTPVSDTDPFPVIVKPKGDISITKATSVGLTALGSDVLKCDVVGNGLKGELHKVFITSTESFLAVVQSVIDDVAADGDITVFKSAGDFVEIDLSSLLPMVVDGNTGSGFTGFQVSITNQSQSTSSNNFVTFIHTIR